MATRSANLETTEQIAVWLIERLAASRGLVKNAVDRTERFSRYGLDSLGAARLIGELSSALGRPLSPTLVWEYPTIEALADHLTGGDKDPGARRRAGPGDRSRSLGAPFEDPIAIVGMAARLPHAANAAAFWQLLRAGEGAVAEVPEGRWDDAVLGDPAVPPEERDKVRRAAFLDRVDEFDPLFFGISPREAAAMDPQQRLLLELTIEALEDAGIPPSSIHDTDTAVLVGAIWSEYAMILQQAGLSSTGPYTITGTHHSILANRISYVLGLHGPSFAIDSACSSGLVVAHLAAESLRSGESTLAIVGAVNLTVLPESAVGVSRFGALSQDGNCYTFDARANGYVRGEGGGILILKRLSRAVADGNPVYAILRGSAVNNDGASNGLTAPNPRAQESVLRAAYERAGIAPADVQYVEAHGTGTPLGDPIEARALGAVLGQGHGPESPLLVGSAKTNVGHLEGAAGTVGLLKVALSIRHRLLPPSRNFESPNPHVDLAALHIEVPTKLRPWPEPDKRLLAGVSSFGLGGTNGHVVLEEWPAPRAEAISLRAAGEDDLRRRVAELRGFVAGPGALLPLREIAATALTWSLQGDSAAHPLLSARGSGSRERVLRPEPLLSARGSGSRERVLRPEPLSGPRVTFVARSHRDLDASLEKWLSGEPRPSIHPDRKASSGGAGPVFVYPGQGAQWQGMALSLLHREPVIRATIERCDAAIRRELGWSLMEELVAPAGASRLHDIEVSLPAIISIDIAVSEWWRSMGIEPSAVVGHSTGEIAAAYVCGALDLDDTMRVICAYGKLITRMSGKGGMALVGLPWDRAESVLDGFEGRVHRAIADSAEATVLAGEPAALDALVAAVSEKGIFCRKVAMNVSPHCPLVDGLRDELFEALRSIRPRPSAIPLISEVTGAEVPGESLDAAHWVKNFGDPAFFSRAVDDLIRRGHRVFIDVGPHPLTKHSVETNLRVAGAPGHVLASLRRDEDERTTLLDTLAELGALGLGVRWTALYPEAVPAAPASPPFLLPLSAKSPEAVSAYARALAELMIRADAPPVTDIVYSASSGREHYRHRAAVAGVSAADLASALQKVASGEVPEGSSRGDAGTSGKPKLVFVMTGQGSQWVGMGQKLRKDDPVFRETLESIDRLLRRHVPWSLLEELDRPEESSRLADTEVVQPALFAIQVGLARSLAAAGIRPDAVIGHSIGEVAAAHVSGALSVEDAVRLVAERGRAMQKATGKGKMAWVALPFDEATKIVEPLAPAVTIGAVNDPGSVVLSGEGGALDAIVADLSGRGIACRPLRVNYAFHSAQMADHAAELAEKLHGLRPRDGAVPMFSTVTAALVEGPSLDAEYWRRNVRDAVRFAPAVEAAVSAGYGLFLEVGPHPSLLSNIEQCIAQGEEPRHATFTLRRKEDESAALRSAIGRLFIHGAEPDFHALSPLGTRVPLPPYPWQRQRLWTAVPKRSKAGLLGGEPGPYRLSGSHAELPEGRCLRTIPIGPLAVPSLGDHRVYGRVVVPAALWVSALLAIGARSWPESAVEITDLEILSPLVLSEAGDEVETHVVCDPDGERMRVSVHTRSDDGGWSTHARGHLGPSAASLDEGETLAERRSHILRPSSPAVLFDHLSAMEVLWGEKWQWLKTLQIGDQSGLGELSAPGEEQWTDAPIPPGLLDNGLGLLLSSQLGAAVSRTFLPFSIERVVASPLPARPRWAIGAIRKETPDLLSGDVQLWDEAGRTVARMEGIALRLAPRDRFFRAKPGDNAYRVRWTAKPLPDERPTLSSAAVIGSGPLADKAVSALSRAGARVSRFATVQELLGAAHEPGAAPDLTVWAGATPQDGVAAAPERALALSTTALADLNAWCASEDAAAGRLVLLTRGGASTGAFDEPLDPAFAAVWGLARTARTEQPDLAIHLLDVDDDAETAALLPGALASTDEAEAALRRGVRFTGRLVPFAEESGAPLEVPEGGEYCLESTERGRLDRLDLRPSSAATAPLNPDQVRVGVRAAGLNFRDIVNALGMYPGEPGPIGVEGAGVVLEVGSDVRGLSPGDRVMGVIPRAFGPVAVATRQHLCRVPDSLSFVEAATVPVAFLTAHRGLVQLGDIRPGQKVLVHAAAGGVGLAAIQIARRAGAEIFATASPSKWPLLQAQGIAADHIASSRSVAFGDAFLRVTGGSGVDLVLNSLAGELTDASLALLPRGGRFLEMGKTDLRSPEDIQARYPGVRYVPFDILDMSPEAFQSALEDLAAALGTGDLAPLPHRVLDLRRARGAFHAMAQGQHTGKLVLVPPAPLDRDGTALITGGTGGLGATVARHLVEKHGVRHLLLVSRAGESALGAPALMDALRSLGALTVNVRACDVGDRQALERVLRDIPAEHPLTAVIHTAGLLRDGVLATTDPAQVAEVFRPKVGGAFHLHELCADLPLSAFVLFSSVAGVIGNAGQGAYAAANTWLDALAAYRQGAGLPAVSIPWGAWAEAGMVSRLSDTDRARIERQGVRALSSAEALAQLDVAMRAGDAVLVAAALDPAAFAARTEPVPALLEGLVQAVARPAKATTPAARGLREQLLETPQAERERVLVDIVRAEVGRVLGLGGAAAVPAGQPLRELGLDSLTAVDLRTRLNALAGTKLRATVVFDHPTSSALARFLLGELHLDSEPSPPAAEPPAEPALDIQRAIAALRVATPEDLRAVGLAAPLSALLARLGDRVEAPEPASRDLDTAGMAELFSVIDQELETLR